jgi:hypothetical protein
MTDQEQGFLEAMFPGAAFELPRNPTVPRGTPG